MTKGWEIKKLGEVLQKTETINPKKSPLKIFQYVDVSCVSKETYRIQDVQQITGSEAPSRARRGIRRNDVIFATIRPTLKRIAVIPEQLDGQVCSTGFFVMRPKDELNYRFLFYYLFTKNYMDQMEILQKGASYPAVNDGQVRAQEIPLPPLKEQKRIVEILDEAFAAIETAKANTETNLKNARALFDSHLNQIFSQRGEGWEKKRLVDVCVLQRGFDLPTRHRKQGEFPLVSANGITDHIDQWKVETPGVTTGRSGTIGNVTFIESKFWPLNTTLYVKDFYSNKEKCVYYFLTFFGLGKFRSGAGVPTLNRNHVHSEMVYFPIHLSEQNRIVDFLDAINNKVLRVESICQKKLTALDELKTSLLHQAFSGEL